MKSPLPLSWTAPLIFIGMSLIIYVATNTYFKCDSSVWMGNTLILAFGVWAISTAVERSIDDQSYILLVPSGAPPPNEEKFQLSVVNTASFPFTNVAVRLDKLGPPPEVDTSGFFRAPKKIGDVEAHQQTLADLPLLSYGKWQIDIYSREEAHFVEMLEISQSSPIPKITLRRAKETKLLVNIPQ